MECHRTHEAKQIPMRLTLWVRWQYCPSPQSFFEKCNFPYKEMSQASTRRHSLIRRIIKRSRCLGLPHWWVCVPESRSICASPSHSSAMLYLDAAIAICLTSPTIWSRPLPAHCLVRWGDGSLPMASLWPYRGDLTFSEIVFTLLCWKFIKQQLWRAVSLFYDFLNGQ